ncbi:MAG: head-tail adaptor protein [Chloroflexi bacterium]|nr:head-tail adaptor protein [Chloroflexota bacterium]
MSFAGLLDSTVNVIRLVTADDNSGGQTTTDTIILRRIPCRFEALSGKQAQAMYAKLTTMPDMICYMQFHSGIKEGDGLVDSKGREYAIALVEDWSLQGRYLKLAVTEIARGEA